MWACVCEECSPGKAEVKSEGAGMAVGDRRQLRVSPEGRTVSSEYGRYSFVDSAGWITQSFHEVDSFISWAKVTSQGEFMV